MPATIEDQGMVEEGKGRLSLWPIFRGITSIAALWAFISELLVFLHGERLGTALPWVFLLSSYLLMTLPPKSWRDWFLFLFVFPGFASLANKAEANAKGTERAKHRRPLDWPVVAYFVIVGLGCNWAIAFLWFSRGYAPLSGPSRWRNGGDCGAICRHRTSRSCLDWRKLADSPARLLTYASHPRFLRLRLRFSSVIGQLVW